MFLERKWPVAFTRLHFMFFPLPSPLPFFFGSFLAHLPFVFPLSNILILPDRNLEPQFGNLPYPEKVPGTTRSAFGKIDKNYDIFTFCETVHGNQNLEPLPKMVLGEPKMTTLSQFFTRKVPVKLAE